MATVARPDTDWLDHASAVGVDGIGQVVLDACAEHGGVSDTPRQGILLQEPAGGWANPRLLGWVHEWSSSIAERSKRGAFYTPPEFAAAAVDAALEGADLPAFTVDPACGGESSCWKSSIDCSPLAFQLLRQLVQWPDWKSTAVQPRQLG